MKRKEKIDLIVYGMAGAFTGIIVAEFVMFIYEYFSELVNLR